ncbi:hypothetical protein [Flavobacterium sp. HNIBRBA15423]|uniref:hypothetical protein n=1 Tax=Flavobacterium sp. HNIBRBA15423 TaxID=3458683 RepID=UPI00404437A1
MDTQVIIRPAIYKDLFSDYCNLVPNKITFEFSFSKNEFQGPYCIQDGYYDQEYFEIEYLRKLLYPKKNLFVLDFKESQDSFKITVKLRLAKPDDLKASRTQLKYNFSYFIYDKNKMLGPFTIVQSLSANEIKYWLDNERVYVIDYADRQTNLKTD